MIQAENIATQVVWAIPPKATLKEAITLMSYHDIGFLPVVANGQTVGVVTDRDIALKGLAQGSAVTVHVDEIMSENLVWVPETATLQEVAQVVAEHRIRRVLVQNARKALVGVISVDDLAVFSKGDQTAGQILQKMAKPHHDLQLPANMLSTKAVEVCQKPAMG